MAWWFVRGVLRGVVTTRYPAREEPSARTWPTPPTFRSQLLTTPLVDELVAICPSHALRREGGTLCYDVGACVCCGRCIERAGQAAMPCGSVELAARARDQLVKQVPILGGHDD